MIGGDSQVGIFYLEDDETVKATDILFLKSVCSASSCFVGYHEWVSSTLIYYCHDGLLDMPLSLSR